MYRFFPESNFDLRYAGSAGYFTATQFFLCLLKRHIEPIQKGNSIMQGLKARTIEEVLALPDEEIDIATAILLLSKQWDSTVDVEKYRKQIDEIATLLKPIVAK